MAIQQRNLEQLQVFSVRAPATLSADGDTTGVNLSAIDGDALFILDAGTSSAGTIEAKLQHAPLVGGEYVDVPGGAFAQLTATPGVQKVAVPREELGPFFRITFTGLAAAYSAPVSCVAVGAARYAV
jgi:hypothetical protein